MDSLCHPWFTTTNLSYRFPILKLPPPPCAVLLVYNCLMLQSIFVCIPNGRGRRCFDKDGWPQQDVKAKPKSIEVYSSTSKEHSGHQTQLLLIVCCWYCLRAVMPSAFLGSAKLPRWLMLDIRHGSVLRFMINHLFGSPCPLPSSSVIIRHHPHDDFGDLIREARAEILKRIAESLRKPEVGSSYLATSGGDL